MSSENSDIGPLFWRAVSNLLAERHLSFEKLDRLAGMSVNYCRRRATEGGEIGIGRASMIARALGVSLDDLLSESSGSAVGEEAAPYRRKSDHTICPNCGEEIIVKVAATFVKASDTRHNHAAGA